MAQGLKSKPWDELYTFGHYQLADRSDLATILEFPSRIDAFTDVFYDDENSRLGTKNVFVSKRNDQWRLEFSKAYNDCLGENWATQLVEGKSKVQTELRRYQLNLSSLTASGLNLFTLRVTTAVGVVDITRLPNGAFYPVMVVPWCSPSPHVRVGNAQQRSVILKQASSKMSACNVGLLEEEYQIDLEDLSPALLYHISDVPPATWSRSILLSFLPKLLVSRLMQHPRKFLEKHILAQFAATGSVEGVMLKLKMIQDAPCVQNLLSNLSARRRRTARHVVRRWLSMVFAGRFVPCCRPQFGGPSELAPGNSQTYAICTRKYVVVHVTTHGEVFMKRSNDNEQDETVGSAAAVIPESVKVYPSLEGSMRFFHGTTASAARAILESGPNPSNDTNDFGSGFYMTSDFSVAAECSSQSAWHSPSSGEGDPCVLVLDISASV